MSGPRGMGSLGWCASGISRSLSAYTLMRPRAPADLDQLEQIAAGYATRERF